MVEDAPDSRACAILLELRVRPEIDPLEHERPQGKHRTADLIALDDVALPLGALDEIVDERVDALRAAVSEQGHLCERELCRVEDPEADGIVDVVVDVGHAVDDPDDLALEARGLLRAGVREDSVANLFGEIQRLCDPQRLLVVPKAPIETLLQSRIE